jgi:transposase
MRPAFSGKPASFALRIAGGDSIMQGQTASGPSYRDEYLHFISFECSFGFAMTVVSHEGWRRIVTLLPDREPATAGAWFAARPTISIVARDRGGGYGEAVAKALPHAVQVADRWHLMENASRAFLDAVRKSMRPRRNER